MHNLTLVILKEIKPYMVLYKFMVYEFVISFLHILFNYMYLIILTKKSSLYTMFNRWIHASHEAQIRKLYYGLAKVEPTIFTY